MKVVRLALVLALLLGASSCTDVEAAPARIATADPAAPTVPATSAPSPAAPTFQGTVEVLPAGVVAQMTGVSWKPGCPVPLAALRLVRVSYRGFDGLIHSGELVAHADVSGALVRVFGKLFDAGFPIRKMVRVDAYGADDHASMADDNTSMFNCRRAEGSTSWSRHAYGKAIDINTVENPYVRGRTVLPPAGRAFLDRANVRPAMIVAGDVVTRAFAAEGFRWGGDYRSLKDYQHFEILT